MGAKSSSSKCTPTTVDYIKKKDIKKLTRQLGKRSIFSRNKKEIKNNEENNIQLSQLHTDDDEEQRSELHFAAIDGNSSIIVALYEYMHTVDVADASGRTPLHYAAIVGNEETLTTLLLCNPDVNRISKDGTTPLHEAIIHNHPHILTILVRHNADVNIFYQDYLPILNLTVYLKNKNIVELLIRLGIDPNLTDVNMGRTALHYAAYFHENTNIFHILLSSTVHYIIDINAQDDNGYSIIDYARSNIHGSTDILDLLLKLNVFDPCRGEIENPNLRIEKPTIKIFQSTNELSLLNKKNKKSKF